MARFVYINEIEPNSWLHWSPKANSSCLRDYRFSPVRKNYDRTTPEIDQLLTNPGNFWEMAPYKKESEEDFWREQISLKNVESGLSPIDKFIPDVGRLLDIFKAKAKPLLRDEQLESLHTLWLEWVEKFQCVLTKEQFNHWDNKDATPLFGFRRGIGWTAIMLERCRRGNQLNWISTGHAHTDFALLAMDLRLGISSKRNLFQEGETDIISPDGLGIRRQDGTFCVVEVKGPGDPENLYDATLQALCGLLAVYAKRDMILKIGQSQGSRRCSAPSANIPPGIRSLGLYVLASPNTSGGDARDPHDSDLNKAAKLIIETCPFVRDIVYMITAPTTAEEFDNLPLAISIT